MSKLVDLDTYPRRRLFACFRDHPLPMFSITTSIDINRFPEALEQRGWRCYTTLCCLISQAINASHCFRYRLVVGVLMEFARVHPSINVALEVEGFPFADACLSGLSDEDYISILIACDWARQQPIQHFRGGVDDRFFLTHLSTLIRPQTPTHA